MHVHNWRSVLTKCTPQVGSYAFTTLQPQLGTVVGDVDSEGVDGNGGSSGSVSSAKSLILADIPGLIAGAHEDR
jgi:GTPase involved in cell partitioning and DNA repair